MKIAFDSMISELVWMGIKPINAYNLAVTLYPNEKLCLDKTNMEIWIDDIINLDSYKFDIFCPNEDFENYDDAITKIENSKNICFTNIYIDGSNLKKSFQYLKENIEVCDNSTIRTISIKKENYQESAQKYIEHYLAWCILSAKSNSKDNIFVKNIYFVLAHTDHKSIKYLNKIKDKFGFQILIAQQNGSGYGSCSLEDLILKNQINSDLENNLFDLAIICTGDANKKDGERFTSIANKIKDAKKGVQFTSFGLSTSKKIKNNFDWFDLSEKMQLPRYDNIESRISINN